MVANLILAALLAQDPAALFQKAPPHIEEALRARVTTFYQHHVDGKFTQALRLVAEDSGDAFLGADKKRCRSFEIIKLTFSDNFTRANVLVGCDTDFVMPASKPIPVTMPQPSQWKVADGNWFWFSEPIDPNKGVDTPFGTMRPGAPGDRNLEAGHIPLAVVQSAVKANKSEAKLSSFEPASDEITITNSLSGQVTLALDLVQMPGFEARLDRTELKANEKAILHLRYTPGDRSPKPTLTARVRVQPTNQVIPIQITFAVPAGLNFPR